MGKGELRASIELVEGVFHFPEGMHIRDVEIKSIAGGYAAGGYDELVFVVEHDDIPEKESLPQIEFIFQTEYIPNVSLKKWTVEKD